MSTPQPSSNAVQGRPYGGRYEIGQLLGRGGMASVHRAVDLATGREVALKQLAAFGDESRRREAAALFEREFHVLSQLAHPRVIEVYDYGTDGPTGPYYTMELLDGGDLAAGSPMPWQQACALVYDVCSSLALLHSRRLLHRDISPANIRRARGGRAKLIDFGAMVPFGWGARIVGTPAFAAPEIMSRAMLDARTDLFSLGATLYFLVTGRPPYPARSFAHLPELWSRKAPPPSAAAAQVPEALDALVMSLLSLDPALRPRSAYDVMQRLLALSGECAEDAQVSQAYLVTPSLIGREQTLGAVRAAIAHAARGRGGGLLLCGTPGVGRSRLLDACALEAKTLGATVLRATGRALDGPLSLVRRLAAQAAEVAPEGALAAIPAGDGAAQRNAMRRSLRRIARERPLVVLVDDAERSDDASTALLAALADEARGRRVLLLASADADALACKGSTALTVLASRCTRLDLQPLDREQTRELLTSVFGDVPYVALLSERLHAISRGKPRECMELAQHLVDKKIVTYAGGAWTLPARLDATALPASAEQMLRERVAALSPLARSLAQAQALMLGSPATAFDREDYRTLAGSDDTAAVDRAISELLSCGLLSSDGRLYALPHAAAVHALAATIGADTSRQHAALAELCRRRARPELFEVHHLLAAGLHQRALPLLFETLESAPDRAGLLSAARMDGGQLIAVLERALFAALSRGGRARELADLRRWIIVLSGVEHDEVYRRHAPAWLAQLEHDTGLQYFREIGDAVDESQRLSRALEHAVARYDAAAEAERVYRVDEAIKLLAQYVAVSIAVGARTFDARLLASLPPLLQPFTALSPLVAAMQENALASIESSTARYERARARWISVFRTLSQSPAAQMQNADLIRNAVAYGVGLAEARLGLESAVQWAEILERDPLQRVAAMYLRGVICLGHGDRDGAERFRKRAELLALETSTPQMFSQTSILELTMSSLSGELTGIKQAGDRIAAQLERRPGWRTYAHLAEGHFQRCRGDLEAARAAFERCLSLCAPDPRGEPRVIAAWPTATAAHVETLIELGLAEDARLAGERALGICRELEIQVASYDIVRALALAEAKLGLHVRAAERLEHVIERQLELDVAGLFLGASYEARARVAIWAGDAPAFERYARLTASTYRHGRGSALGARYEQLMDEAQRAGLHVAPELSHIDPGLPATTGFGLRASAAERVEQVMDGATDPAERARRALQLLCEAQGARAGHLYLTSEAGLWWAASIASEPPGDELLRFASVYLRQELDASETATQLEGEAPAASVLTPSTSYWTDTMGQSLQVLSLPCPLSAKMAFAGVAVLAADGHGGMSDARLIAVALGAHFARIDESGDGPR